MFSRLLLLSSYWLFRNEMCCFAQVQPDLIKSVLCALAKVGKKPRQLLTVLAAAVQRQLAAFNPEALSSIAWAWATLAFYPGQQQLDGLIDAALRQLPAFQPQELADLFWALASLRHTPGSRGLDRMVGSVMQRSKAFRPNQLISIFWGSACLGHTGGSVLAAPTLQAMEAQDEVCMSPCMPASACCCTSDGCACRLL